MRRPRTMCGLWVGLWILRVPFSMWYYGLRSYRVDYPGWADSIGAPIFIEWIEWVAGAIISTIILVSLLRGHCLPDRIRWTKPVGWRGWGLTFWMAWLALCVAAGIPDGNEGGVLTCTVATVVLAAVAGAPHLPAEGRVQVTEGTAV